MGGRTGASRNKQMTKLIGKYMSKASKGRYTAPSLVANVTTPGDRSLFAGLSPKDVPVPNLKPGVMTQVAAASVPVPLPPKPIVEPEIVTGSIIRVPQKPDLQAALRRKTMAYASTSSVPTPRAPELAIRKVRTQPIQVASAGADVPLPDAPKSSSVTVATNNVAEPKPAWQVQIAAAESEDAAVAMLKKASSAMGSRLRGYVPYTEPVESGGATLYRARFVGFETKTAAWDACSSLKRKRFNCYAIYQ